jgi:hypothetical protein
MTCQRRRVKTSRGFDVMQLLASALDSIRSTTGTVGRSTGGLVLDVLKVLGAVLLLTLALFLWARYVRRPSRQRTRQYKYPAPATAATTPADAEEEPELQPEQHAHHHRRYRKRKHEHRGRNPTLAEIGGLPPVRDAEPTDKT